MTFYFALRCRAGFFDFRYFTGFSPEIIGFSKTALTFFMKLTGKSPKKSRNSTKMSKMKFENVEGVILHDFAIFGLYEWNSTKTWASVQFNLGNKINYQKWNMTPIRGHITWFWYILTAFVKFGHKMVVGTVWHQEFNKIKKMKYDTDQESYYMISIFFIVTNLHTVLTWTSG